MSLATAPAPSPALAGSLDLRFRGRCDHAKGAVDLSRYPNLAHTSERGVFTHLTATPVADIAAYATASGLVDAIATACIETHATFDELLDALRYARANRQV